MQSAANARGSLPGLDGKVRNYVRGRWSRWLNAQVAIVEGDNFPSRLAAKVNEPKGGISKWGDARPWNDAESRGTITPGRISSWLRNPRSFVEAHTAFRVGEALRECEIASDGFGPKACGPFALHAAGHLWHTIRFLKELARDRAGAREAVVLFCLLPEANRWLTQPEGVANRQTDGFKTVTLGDVEQLYMASIDYEMRPTYLLQPDHYPEIGAHRFELYNSAWKRVRTNAGDPDFTPRESHLFMAWEFATALLNFADALQCCWPVEEAAREVWWIMQRWAALADPMTFRRLRDRLDGYFLDLGQVYFDRHDLYGSSAQELAVLTMEISE